MSSASLKLRTCAAKGQGSTESLAGSPSIAVLATQTAQAPHEVTSPRGGALSGRCNGRTAAATARQTARKPWSPWSAPCPNAAIVAPACNPVASSCRIASDMQSQPASWLRRRRAMSGGAGSTKSRPRWRCGSVWSSGGPCRNGVTMAQNLSEGQTQPAACGRQPLNEVFTGNPLALHNAWRRASAMLERSAIGNGVSGVRRGYRRQG
jgi:hypothetical protein